MGAITTSELREAIGTGNWYRASEIVAPHCRTRTTYTESDGDALQDWLSHGAYPDLDAVTPEQIAQEWDEEFGDED